MPDSVYDPEAEEQLGRAFDRRLAARLMEAARPHRRLIGGSLLLFPLVAVVELAQPWLLKVAIDEHILKSDWVGLKWVAGLYDRCKGLDPTRLVVDNSACGAAWGTNIHVKSDLDDFHVYTAIPDQAGNWMRTIQEFALRPLWTFSAHGDAQRRPWY